MYYWTIWICVKYCTTYLTSVLKNSMFFVDFKKGHYSYLGTSRVGNGISFRKNSAE